VAGHFDLVVSCSHFRFFPHPHRVEIVAPVTQVTTERLQAAAAKWPDLFADAPHPWIVLLVGGSSPQYRLDPETARSMGTRLGALARRNGGTVFAVTSPRTGEQVAAELQHALAGAGRVHQWRAHAKENPYLAYLAGADAIVVTGESESMLAEAVATRKPVYVYDVPKRPLGPVQLATDWITKRAYRKNRKLKGTIRPQQGLEYICARLIQHGFVLPPRDMSVLHRQLFDCGAARPFDDTLELTAPVVLDETATVVERIKTLLGYRDTEADGQLVREGVMASAERAATGAPPR
jgi:mitochondrial fission protein ELM1